MAFETRVTIDRSKRKMVCSTKNTTFAGTIDMHDVSTYYPHPEDSKKTVFNTVASLEIAYIFGVSVYKILYYSCRDNEL